MIAYTISGTLDGRKVEVYWEDGHLSGDADVRTAYCQRAFDRTEVWLTPVGPAILAQVGDPLAAWVHVQEIMDVESVSGPYADEVQAYIDQMLRLPPGVVS